MATTRHGCRALRRASPAVDIHEVLWFSSIQYSLALRSTNARNGSPSTELVFFPRRDIDGRSRSLRFDQLRH
jgi:hypothetical protein